MFFVKIIFVPFLKLNTLSMCGGLRNRYVQHITQYNYTRTHHYSCAQLLPFSAAAVLWSFVEQ